MPDSGYFLIADVLGFGRIVQNLPGAELDARIRAWVDLVQSTADAFGIEKLQLISDTLFVSVPPTAANLAKLLGFSRQILTNGIEQSFPVRGAIVHGTSVWGSLTYGRAVIAAHELEQRQNWIGIACAAELPGAERLWSIDKLVCYPPPFKCARIRLHPVISWPVPDAECLMRLVVRGGLTKKGDILAWDLGAKVNNTVLFRLYLDILRAGGSDPEKFHGLLPVHPIDSALQGR